MHLGVKFMYGFLMAYESLKNVEKLLEKPGLSPKNHRRLTKAYAINSCNFDFFLAYFTGREDLERALRDENLYRGLIDYEEAHGSIDLSQELEGESVDAKVLENVKQFSADFFQKNLPLKEEAINDILVRYDASLDN